MKQKLYQVDAFAERIFEGNPAAVCVLKSWPIESWMQKIAMENNLAETAFLVPNGSTYEIRWFTPELEVDLCGHATLASAFVLFNHEGVSANQIDFHSPRSGALSVARDESGYLILDFPSDSIEKIDPYTELNEVIGKTPLETWKGKTDYLLVYDSQNEIESIQPDFYRLNKIDARGIIVTAPGRDVDFVSRFFAPQSGISEDPVTGSAHTSLTPYWSKKLGKTKLRARQISQRGGNLWCEYEGARVKIGGKAVLYLIGEIQN